MTPIEHARLAIKLTPVRALGWFLGLLAFLIFAASVVGCRVTELHDCTLALDEVPPNGQLVCAGRTIPVHRLAPWIWEAVRAHRPVP